MIKLRAILERSGDLVTQVEQELFGFDFIQDKYHKDERRKPGYKREMDRLLPLIKKLGFDKAKEADNVVVNYTGRVYGRTNKSLRADKVPANATIIDQYIEAAPKFKGVELYRGIGKDLYLMLTTSKSKSFIDKAFTSSTEDYKTAEQFARRTGKGAVIKLTGALGNAAQAPLSYILEKGEAEYIFPRNTRMEIVKIEGDVIHMKVL